MSAAGRPRVRHREVILLGVLAMIVLALGWVVARDLRRSAEDARQLYQHLASGLDFIDDLQFNIQETRRTLLYALHTTDANRQLKYADQSRAAEATVNALLARESALTNAPNTRPHILKLQAAWQQYLEIRDDVIGLILEMSLSEAVALDEERGTSRFNDIRDAIAELKYSFESNAAVRAAEARTRADRATWQLTLLVMSALAAATVGIYLLIAARAKSDFLATMSHELRTPLTGVIGIADVLQASRLPPQERELVRMLRSSANSLFGLVSDILDYSRIEAGLLDLAPRPFSMARCVEDALDPVTEAAARKGLEIGYVIDPGVPAVIADDDRVKQVLLNLLSNAVKFTNHGEVAVRVSAAPPRDGRVMVSVDVRDTGIGIPEHLQHRLFHRFSQIDSTSTREHGGAGLGLAISERLSRHLGGSLSAQSTEGCGSTFTFTFSAPLANGWSAVDPVGDRLAGVQVFARLQPGIVRDQVSMLLARWGAGLIVGGPAEPLPGEGDCDAILVDADRFGRPGATHERLILITRHQAPVDLAQDRMATPIVPKPVRALALAEAIAAAAGVPWASAAAPPSQAIEALASGSLSILLVEDNDPNRRVVQLMLAELGLGADEASCGADAIARATAREYDVILMDVQMPGIDGLEATRRIRAQQRGKRPIILALTANVMEGDAARCRLAGADGYLPKPVRIDDLSAALAPHVH
jgi:signal transduction histidine kinase/CheY-like chemotaxis protein